MSEMSRLATAFEERSKEQAESTEKAVRSAFEKHESALLSALSESEKRTSDAIRAQSRSLLADALRSWMAVTIPIIASLALGLGAMVTMGWYITGQINEIASHNATLEQLKNEGGAIQLSRCGESRRLCARIDESAGVYGEDRTYRVLEGY
uniref:MobB protein n=1 Tax=Halomonas elongata TaxID=2746 RepID=Q9K590_HALEL|nr:MobB protein [Halomonas elongata]